MTASTIVEVAPELPPTKPPRGWKPPRPPGKEKARRAGSPHTPDGMPRPPKPPKPPRRPPVPPRPEIVLTPQQRLARASLGIVAALLFAFVANIMVLSHLQHLVAQQQLTNTFRTELANGTAPVSEGTVDDVLLADGAPVALLDIPSIGVHEIVVEGTDGATTRSGPGHRRDTGLPGQAGVSVIMGRASAYGGPFSRIQELQPGEKFTVITGQGEAMYEVVGVRYAGDPSPPSPAADEGRLILETARGVAYSPTGIARVDANLISETQPRGIRQTTFASLPAADKEMATDPSTVWALVFALQFLLVLEVAAVWAFRTVGARKTWVVLVPAAVLGGLLVADQVTRLLPNLL